MEVYAAMVDRLDRGVGTVLDALKDANVAENTVVMFLSDNGGCVPSRKIAPDGANSTRQNAGTERYVRFLRRRVGLAQCTPFRRFKTWCYEGGIATPLIVRGPGIAGRGKITHQVGHVVDVMPSLLELAGGATS